MATETFPFDAAEHLTDPEDQADLLNEALASKDAATIAAAMGIIARARGMTVISRRSRRDPKGAVQIPQRRW